MRNRWLVKKSGLSQNVLFWTGCLGCSQSVGQTHPGNVFSKRGMLCFLWTSDSSASRFGKGCWQSLNPLDILTSESVRKIMNFIAHCPFIVKWTAGWKHNRSIALKLAYLQPLYGIQCINIAACYCKRYSGQMLTWTENHSPSVCVVTRASPWFVDIAGTAEHVFSACERAPLSQNLSPVPPQVNTASS